MEKYAWKATVKEGCMDEYIRRHDNLPEDMKQLLREAGICNYTIWNVGNELFGYYECRKGVDFAAKTQNESPIVKRWEPICPISLLWKRTPSPVPSHCCGKYSLLIDRSQLKHT